MFQAFAPRMPRGCSRVWLAIAVVAFAPQTIIAQAPPVPKGEMKPKPEEAKPEAKPDDGDDAEPTAEIFLDPNAKKTLSIFNPLNFPAGQAIKVGNPPDDRSRVQSMAAREVNVDPDFLKRFVEFFAVELSKRDNLNAILNPPGGLKPTDPAARALERAVDALIKPLQAAKANNNSEFLTNYSRILFESSLPKLLENNYLSRIDAMIVLGMAGSNASSALDLYTNQIKKPDQVVWVKLWAARGLTNASQGGKIDLEAGKSTRAVEALVDFLEGDPKMPWPAQMRALQALGSLRLASANSPKGKIDVASVVMRLLADPENNPEVRSWASWALGMMRVPAAITPYNYTLIGHEIGGLAAELGKQIVEEYDDDPANFDKGKDQAAHLTGLLLFQIYPALIGEDGVRDSGLLHSAHPDALAARSFLSKVDEKVKAVTRGAYELLRAGGVGNLGKRNELDVKVTDLKAFLAQNKPKDRHLVPGGPEFAPIAEEQVAGAAGR